MHRSRLSAVVPFASATAVLGACAGLAHAYVIPTPGDASSGQPTAASGFGGSTLAASEQFGSEGGTLSADLPGGSADISVPPGFSPTPIDLGVLAPDLGELSAGINGGSSNRIATAARTRFKVLTGLGLTVRKPNGKPLSRLPKPLNIRISTKVPLPRNVQVRVFDPSRKRYVAVHPMNSHGVAVRRADRSKAKTLPRPLFRISKGKVVVKTQKPLAVAVVVPS